MEAAGAATDDVLAPLNDAPRSTSSAMPDPASPNVPVLKARVHQRLSAAQCARIPLSALHFRPLQVEDLDEMVALHTEWFPVSYDEAFYSKSVQGEIFTLVATHRSEPGPRSSWSRGGAGGSAADEDLLGIITLSTSCEHHGDDTATVLGADCSVLCAKPPRPKDTLPVTNEGSSGCLAYILTIGVADNFRRRGLARELLKRSIAHVNRNMPQVLAVYLHVVTYNEAAIRLYESMGFLQIGHFTPFYYLHGKPYDSFLYARYLHGGRPPWRWRLRSLLSIGAASSWRDWVVSAWSSIWRGDALGEKPVGTELP